MGQLEFTKGRGSGNREMQEHGCEPGASGRIYWRCLILPHSSSSLHGTEGLGREQEGEGQPCHGLSRCRPDMVTRCRQEGYQEGGRHYTCPRGHQACPGGAVWARGPGALPSKPRVHWDRHWTQRRPESELVWLQTDVLIRLHWSATRGSEPCPWAHEPGIGASPLVRKCRRQAMPLYSGLSTASQPEVDSGNKMLHLSARASDNQQHGARSPPARFQCSLLDQERFGTKNPPLRWKPGSRADPHITNAQPQHSQDLTESNPACYPWLFWQVCNEAWGISPSTSLISAKHPPQPPDAVSTVRGQASRQGFLFIMK